MEQIGLTYNPLEDRMMIMLSTNVSLPNWWLTRHMCKKLVKMLSAELSLTHKLESIQKKLIPNENFQTLAQKHSKAIENIKSYSFKNTSDVNYALGVELASRICISKKNHGLVEIYFYSSSKKGICLDLDNKGLHIFLDIVIAVAVKANWGITYNNCTVSKFLE